jgi:primosomal protein N'
MVIEVGDAPQWAPQRVSEAVQPPAMALGPIEAFERHRWLIQGPDLSGTRQALKAVVQEMRDAHAQVRVDVDPLDL